MENLSNVGVTVSIAVVIATDDPEATSGDKRESCMKKIPLGSFFLLKYRKW